MTWSRHRIHSGDDFRATSRKGVRSARSHVVVHLALLPGSPEGPRVGFVVSKAVGNSVVRHRVTRRLREIVRPRLGQLPTGSTCVVRALPGIDDAVFADLEVEVDGALGAAVRKLVARGARVDAGTGKAGTAGVRALAGQAPAAEAPAVGR